MFSLSCPHCGATVRIFSAEWQSQRGTKERVCPSCGHGVEVAFSAKRYVPAAAVLLLVSLAVAIFLGMPTRYFGQVIGPSLGLPLLTSMCLRKAR